MLNNSCLYKTKSVFRNQKESDLTLTRQLCSSKSKSKYSPIFHMKFVSVSKYPDTGGSGNVKI